MRMSDNRRRVLEALQERDFLQWGTPPYSAATVTSIINAPDVNNVARTLRQLAAAGLAERIEAQPVPVWSEVQRGHCDRKQAAYWNSSTKAADQQAADEWQAGASERGAEAWQAFSRMLIAGMQ